MKTFSFTKKIKPGIIALVLLMTGMLFSQKAEACKAAFTDTVVGTTVKFTSASTTSGVGVKYYWTFGDGNTGTGSPVYHTYASGNTSYKVTLYLIDSGGGCTDSISKFIKTGCSASSYFNFTNGAAGSVAFNNYSTTSSGHFISSWTFGDGTHSNVKSPSHTYSANGVYHVCLYVVDSSNTSCNMSFCRYDTVKNAGSCYAYYAHSLSGGTLYTSNTSSSKYGYTSSWSWGDGTANSTTKNPVHVYTKNGTYIACLTITDTTAKCSASDCDTIIVSGACTANFDYNASKLSVTFSDSLSSALVHAHNASWNFGDGTSTGYGDKTSHIYGKNGTYTVCVTVYDSSTGCSAQHCANVTVSLCSLVSSYKYNQSGYKLSFASTSTGVTSHTRYKWYFGDGSTDSTSGSTVSHTYTTSLSSVVVYLVLYDSVSGCTAYYSRTILLCAVKSDFGYKVSGLTAAFKADSTNNATVQYEWSFGDLTYLGLGNNPAPSHTYKTSGTDSVCLFAEDSITGCRAKTCNTITVSNCSLSAAFYDTISGHTVKFYGFSNASSHSSIRWYFGDGAVDSTSGFITHHTYGSSVSTENVYLRVYDSTTKCLTYGSKTITLCTALSDYTYSVNGLAVSFKADAANKSTAKYQWDFADKTSAGTTADPTHTYSAAGTYNICLTVTDSAGGCSTTTCHSITVTNCTLTASFGDSVGGHTVYFTGSTNASLSHSSIKWFFGDGSVDSTSGLGSHHTYASSVTSENVYLRVYDSTTKCLVYASKTITLSGCTLTASFTDSVDNHKVKFFGKTNASSHSRIIWFFGDNTADSTSGLNVTHTYASSISTANVYMRVYDSTTKCLYYASVKVNLSYCIAGVVTTGKAAGYPAWVYLITYNSVDSSLSAIDSTMTNSSGAYEFCGLSKGTYYTKAALTDSNHYYKYFIPTYNNDATKWDSATRIVITGSSVTGANIAMKLGKNPGGAGFIGGKITQGANKTGDAEPGVLVVLYDADGNAVTYTYSNNKGDYSFSGIAFGTYTVWGEVLNKVCYPAVVTVTDTSSTVTNADLLVNSTTVTAAIKPVGTWNLVKVNVYPNPVTNKLTLSLSLRNSGPVSLKVYDVTGKVVTALNASLEGGAQKLEVDASSLPAGLYLLRMEMLKDNTLMEAQFVKAR